ncbi:MAG TPA: hypothetical protein PK816_05930 [Candidatus Cloacimonadota bacterium]|nr:hypothetical protein [Candidatus Cloacimonadota bacterium]
MKLGLSSKIRLFILLAMLISISSYFSLLFFISGSDIEKNLKNDLSNIIWGSLILNFGLSLYLIGNIGNYIHKSLAAVRFLIQEISKGNYNVQVDIPCDTDPEIQNVMGSLDYMQEVILHYDNLKKEKIVENRNRIIKMLNLSIDGFIILNIKGQIIYISDVIKKYFKYLEENTDIVNTHFQADVELSIKKYILQIIKTHSKIDPQTYYISSLKKHIFVKGNLVRDSRGIPIGIVICVNNLESGDKDTN